MEFQQQEGVDLAPIKARQKARSKIEHLHGSLCLTAVEGQQASNDCAELITEIERHRARIQVLETSVDYLRYLVDHPVKQELWRPIETAKEDGATVLVCDEGAIFRALLEDGRWIDIECDQPVVPPPSHWMPMPSPPSIAPPVAPAEGEQ